MTLLVPIVVGICMYHALQLQMSHRDSKNSPISIAEANQQKGFMNIQYTVSQTQGSD